MEKDKLKSTEKIKRTVTGMLELPKEIVLNQPLISLVGNDELHLENYKGVIEYTEEKIRLNTSTGILKIEGRKLLLKQITAENVTITGIIDKLEYIK